MSDIPKLFLRTQRAYPLNRLYIKDGKVYFTLNHPFGDNYISCLSLTTELCVFLNMAGVMIDTWEFDSSQITGTIKRFEYE